MLATEPQLIVLDIGDGTTADSIYIMLGLEPQLLG